MKARKITPGDKEAVLTSFKPLFGDWDYLPLVIDDWLEPSSVQETWVAYSGTSDEMLVAMAQAYELEPGDWYLRGLRSNPSARPHQVAQAILALVRTIERELRMRVAESVRYGTLAGFQESLRLAALLGFREHFRLGHAWHPLPGVPDNAEGVEVEVADDGMDLLDYLKQCSVLKPVDGYFFSWWDTRELQGKHLIEAQHQGLLLKAFQNDRMIGAALFRHVPWQEFLVLSIMDGTDEALKALYRAGLVAAHRMGCKAVGMVHPSLKEMHRRQRMFGLQQHGEETVQLIYTQEGTR